MKVEKACFMTYNELAEIYEKNPHDVHTVPKQKGCIPRWFYVRVRNHRIYVEPAKNHEPSSCISSPRALNPQKFDAMLNLHRRRENMEPVSQEAELTTVNQVYWYGIFSDVNL